MATPNRAFSLMGVPAQDGYSPSDRFTVITTAFKGMHLDQDLSSNTHVMGLDNAFQIFDVLVASGAERVAIRAYKRNRGIAIVARYSKGDDTGNFSYRDGGME